LDPMSALSNFALEGTGQDQDADQDGAADLLLSPGTSGSRSITLDDVLANVPEETGDFFVDTFPSQSGSISSGSASPDWETIRTLLGLPESEFDSNGAPPPRDNSAIADTGSGTTQAGTALVNMTVGKDGEVKGGGTTSDDPFLNAASNAITGQLGNARDAMNNALQDQDSIGCSAPGAAVDDGSKKNGTTVVHDAGPDKNGNPTTMTVWTSDDGKIEITTTSWGDTILYNANNGTTTVTRKDGSTETTNHTTGEVTTTDPLKCPAPDETPPLTPEEKARLIATIGEELHIPQPGEAQAGGDIDYGPDGAPVSVGGNLPDMQAVKEFLIGQPGPDANGGAGANKPLRPDPEAGGDIDPTEDAYNPHGTGPEDDPLNQGHDFTDDTGFLSGADAAQADRGDSFTAFDFPALDLRRADDPGAALKDHDFALLQQQSAPAADIVPEFHLETLPMPDFDLGPVFGNDALV
jgi:hypothetical protein